MTTYGKEIYCLDSLRTGRYVEGKRLVAQAIYRRLTTPRGTLRGGEDELNYGFDLTELVGSNVSHQVAAGRVRNEIRKDSRVRDVTVDVTSSVDGPSTILTVVISAVVDEGPFELVLAVDDVTVQLVKVTL